jgi:hypothetical protein
VKEKEMDKKCESSLEKKQRRNLKINLAVNRAGGLYAAIAIPVYLMN